MIHLIKGLPNDEETIFQLTKEHILQYEIRKHLMDKIIPSVKERIIKHIDDIYRIYDDDLHIGYITLIKMEDGYLQIDDFYILKEYQHQGYGNKVIKYLTDKYHKLQLYVFRSNLVALNLYKKFNFEIIDNDVVMYKMRMTNDHL